MDYNNYLDYKLHEALNKVSKKFGRTKNFTLKDCIDLLSDYGMTFETDLDNIYKFVPTKGNDFTNISTFTKGFINEKDSHIVVCVIEKHLEIFVFGFKSYLLTNYFSLNINNNILDILYQFECMKLIDKQI